MQIIPISSVNEDFLAKLATETWIDKALLSKFLSSKTTEHKAEYLLFSNMSIDGDTGTDKSLLICFASENLNLNKCDAYAYIMREGVDDKFKRFYPQEYGVSARGINATLESCAVDRIFQRLDPVLRINQFYLTAKIVEEN